jgi:hypothetical protein
MSTESTENVDPYAMFRAALASLIRLIWMAQMVAIGTNPSSHPDPLSTYLLTGRCVTTNW